MNKIIWNKWKDPLYPLVKAYQVSEDDEDHDYHEAMNTFDSNEDEYEDEKTAEGWKGPMVIGNIGIVPLVEDNVPSKLFNFWMGDTNFDLTHKMVADIEEVPGVETLDVFTRYRFRMSVGRAFNQNDVMKNIDLKINLKEKDATVTQTENLSAVKNMLSKVWEFWAIFLMKNDKYEYVGGHTVEEVNKKSAKFNGKVKKRILSWEK